MDFSLSLCFVVSLKRTRDTKGALETLSSNTTGQGVRLSIQIRVDCDCVYGKACRINTARGSERNSTWSTLATARCTDPYTHLITDLNQGNQDLYIKPPQDAAGTQRKTSLDRSAARLRRPAAVW